EPGRVPPPRVPTWSRVRCRLVDAGGKDATATSSAVCGYLLADYLEHALELYGADGLALGQLRHVGGDVVWEPSPFAKPLDETRKRGDPARVIGASGNGGRLPRVLQGALGRSPPRSPAGRAG